ncbi:NAD(P)-dependent oxidoreductase [Labrys wisconsinensis]|uniref:NADH-flavin reductase n=1 Tax=Labrys wisconsinensis TaxID=425677 RepID=A0ABU0JCZ1_9HYPH|nr:SDR family oxidoreductase [Labrys wisconsinensis]MDQ0472149.1 putative NADH-flavin reductase [Labrys wisconsinensis]
MKILILGATGGTGRLIVGAAAAGGHEVVALVRSKAKAAGLVGATLVEGDARDEAALSRAIAGCDAVVSALGTAVSPFRKVTLLSTATRALVAVMERQGVRRLVCITGMGAGDSRGHGGFFYDRLFQPLLLRQVYEDKDRQEAAIQSSQLDWIIVRPTVLNDEPARGRVRALTDLTGVHGGRIARADVADFVVQQLAADTWLHRTPLITWQDGARPARTASDRRI